MAAMSKVCTAHLELLLRLEIVAFQRFASCQCGAATDFPVHRHQVWWYRILTCEQFAELKGWQKENRAQQAASTSRREFLAKELESLRPRNQACQQHAGGPYDKQQQPQPASNAPLEQQAQAPRVAPAAMRPAQQQKRPGIGRFVASSAPNVSKPAPLQHQQACADSERAAPPIADRNSCRRLAQAVDDGKGHAVVEQHLVPAQCQQDDGAGPSNAAHATPVPARPMQRLSQPEATLTDPRVGLPESAALTNIQVPDRSAVMYKTKDKLAVIDADTHEAACPHHLKIVAGECIGSGGQTGKDVGVIAVRWTQQQWQTNGSMMEVERSGALKVYLTHTDHAPNLHTWPRKQTCSACTCMYHCGLAID